MKRLRLGFALLLFVASSANAALINIDGVVSNQDIGGYDQFLFSTAIASGENTETAALAAYLNVDAESLSFHKENFEDNTSGWTIGQDGTIDYMTYDFGTGFNADYYMVKIGNKDVGDSHYFFDNSTLLQYALIDLAIMFSQDGNVFSLADFNLGRISHATDFGSELTTSRVSEVPLPAGIWLFGAGLLGLIGTSRKTRV